MLEKHPDIANEQTIIVHFMTCNASSLDFMVYCYTRTTEWVPYHAVKQDVMLKIMDIVARHGAEFPFPTRTLYMAGGEGDAAAQAAMQAESPRQAMSAAAAPPAGSAAPSRPAPGAGAQ
nr:mechanosensitive ion channel domain-containing protein [uncultured Ottowia sp.]